MLRSAYESTGLLEILGLFAVSCALLAVLFYGFVHWKGQSGWRARVDWAAMALAVLVIGYGVGAVVPMWRDARTVSLEISSISGKGEITLGRSPLFGPPPMKVVVRSPGTEAEKDLDDKIHAFPVRESLFPWSFNRYQIMLFKTPETWVDVLRIEDLSATPEGRVMP